MWGFLGVNAQLGYNVLSCPWGYRVAGYEARPYEGGIDYLDVSLNFLVPSEPFVKHSVFAIAPTNVQIAGTVLVVAGA